MSKNQGLNKISINASLVSFKPRQVLLANPKLKPNMDHVSVRALKPEQKTLLLLSIAGFLKSNGFSKTLKKFFSEAQLEKDDVSDCSLDLVHMCCKYFEACDNGSTAICKKIQDLQKDDNSKKDEKAESALGVQTVSKKKKKRSNEDGHAVVMQSEDSSKLNDSKGTEKEKLKEKRKNKKISDSLIQEDEPENNNKDKKKKKNKLDSESLVDGPVVSEDKQGNKAKELESMRDAQTAETTVMNGNNTTSFEGKSVKAKGKGKKKDDSLSQNDSNKTSEEGTTDKERKGSKKRKRLASEENNAEPIDEKEVEESKRRKTEGSEELNRNDDEVNGNLEKREEQSAPNKSMKKQLNGSAEPTTVKAFQRVKVDEVVFTDERLKDNSYWGKDGAEIGYGAKAQEVLGQVRGRDFRHEKTKKKRGSYRGGMIDLQSHSVKFNYSDEE